MVRFILSASGNFGAIIAGRECEGKIIKSEYGTQDTEYRMGK